MNGEPVTTVGRVYQLRNRLKPGERFTLQIRREGRAEEVEIVAQPLPRAQKFEPLLFGVLLPAVYLIVGLAIFLLKPNDKAVLLLSVAFALISMIAPMPSYSALSSPPVLLWWWLAGSILSPFCIAILLHLFLVFPERLRLVRRFPALEWLIYVPYVLCMILPYAAVDLLLVGWSPFSFVFKSRLLGIIANSTPALYLFASLLALLFGYLQASITNKRRIRLLAAGVAFSLVPPLLYILPWDTVFDSNPLNLGEWRSLVLLTPLIFLPVVFAYAIARHKVIPVSFVIRRGLQYILAKNALRLFLIVPLLCIVWNIAANPSRTLYEILFRNTQGFYACVFVAVAFVLLNRFRLNEWIDRRFFRAQYDQEKILRELTEAVKDSDSLPKLSRMVSSKIQSAMHPESVYLFFREDMRQSDFSLGYASSGSGGQSAKLKLEADSALLKFMEQERNAIDFPFKTDAVVPHHDKAWLRLLGANLLVPMHGTDGKLAGFFSLGEKRSEIPYTNGDKQLLETLAHQIALVHENLKLKEHVLREQKIKTEVLSRFDEGAINLLKECPRCGRCYDRNVEKCAVDDAELTLTLPVERTIENRYRLERLIGKGGMGAVYEATDSRLNRTVAVKVLSGAMFGNRAALRRFEREAQTSARLSHPSIVAVHDYGALSTEGAFLVMERLHGETLRQVLEREGRLTMETAARWFSQVLDGVEAAHRAGIVHRDLKPDNIFLARDENGAGVRLRILDFGLARFTQPDISQAASVTLPGTIMGTFGYMSPEQVRGEPTDERSDLFSVGVIIYEALSGSKPFRARSYHELLHLMSSDDFETKFDGQLAEFFKRSLARDAEARFASASEMKRFLLKTFA